MRLLLDTNILIPFFEDRLENLPAPIRAGLNRQDANLYASAVSLWEIAIKVRLGKLPLKIALSDLPLMVDRLQLDPLLITFDHVLADLANPPPTRDPFDRLLLAQCQVENMRLVTIDEALETHPLAWREP